MMDINFSKIKNIGLVFISKNYLRIWLAITISLLIVNLFNIYSFSIGIAILIITFSILHLIKLLIFGINVKELLICYGCFISGIFLIVAKLLNLLIGILGALVFLVLYFVVFNYFLKN